MTMTPTTRRQGPLPPMPGSRPHTGYLKESDFDDVDFLVGTATGHTGAEIVVGTTPGGELGGTWASPTVDATHPAGASRPGARPHQQRDHTASAAT